MALMALRGPLHALGDLQEALLGSMETTRPMGANLVPTMAEDWLAAEKHSSCDNILPSKGSVIRPCYFILLLFHEWRKAATK